MFMDWANWISPILTPGVSGLVGGEGGGYTSAYSRAKGQHVATYQNSKFLLAQEHGKAYEQEKEGVSRHMKMLKTF